MYESLKQRVTQTLDEIRDGGLYKAERGFDVPLGDHPIVPIMLGDAALATKTASMMLDEGVYVIGFSYPVVPMGKARIRVQISAAHTTDDLDLAMNAFAKVRDALKG